MKSRVLTCLKSRGPLLTEKVETAETEGAESKSKMYKWRSGNSDGSAVDASHWWWQGKDANLFLTYKQP